MLVEKGWTTDLQYWCEPTEYHQKRYTARVITDRGTTHEIVRHRSMSFVQESTRYCNYSTNRFDNELTFILPPWMSLDEEDLHFPPEEEEKGRVLIWKVQVITEKGVKLPVCYHCGSYGNLWYEINAYHVIAWKEIVLPKESE